MIHKRNVGYKNRNEYKKLNRQIIKKCTEAKVKQLEDKCKRTEKLQKRNNAREMHAQIKSTMKHYKKRSAHISRIKNKNGMGRRSKKEPEEVWMAYVIQLYRDDIKSLHQIIFKTAEKTLELKCRSQIMSLKKGKKKE